MTLFGRYLLNLLLALDQFGNVLLGGDPDETISSRLGRIATANGGSIPWSRPLSRAAGWALDRIDRDHCHDAIEPDEGDEGVVDRPSGPLPHEEPPGVYQGGNEGRDKGED